MLRSKDKHSDRVYADRLYGVLKSNLPGSSHRRH